MLHLAHLLHRLLAHLADDPGLQAAFADVSAFDHTVVPGSRAGELASLAMKNALLKQQPYIFFQTAQLTISFRQVTDAGAGDHAIEEVVVVAQKHSEQRKRRAECDRLLDKENPDCPCWEED